MELKVLEIIISRLCSLWAFGQKSGQLVKILLEYIVDYIVFIK